MWPHGPSGSSSSSSSSTHHSSQWHPPTPYGINPAVAPRPPYSSTTSSSQPAMMTPTTSSWNPAAASMPFPSPARMPNPYDTTTRPAPTSRPLPVSSPSQPSASRSDDADADYLAALEASRASEAAARAKRQAEEEETLARISALSLASAQSAAAAAASEEAAMLRSVMNASLQEEEQRRRRQEAEARQEVREAMEASRREDERRRNEEEEVLRRVMRESEQEAARQAEMTRQADEARRLEAEARRLDDDQRPELARIQSHRSARPLPPVPQATGGQDDHVPSSSQDDATVGPGDNDDEDDDDEDPFADSAEAPPAYENVHSDRPPEAPSRAPTGMWDEVRATNMAAAAAAAAVAAATSTTAQQRVATDPIAEKRRMEALGAQQQARRTASPEPAASTSVVADDAAGPSSPEAPREKSPTCSTASSGPRTPLGLSWGCSTHPFTTSLDQGSSNGSDSSSPNEPSALRAARFPSTIALASPSMASHTSFTMRSGSWKLLLRALAWLGNTQVAAETPGEARLLIDVEFVTPTHTQQRDHHLHRQKWPTGAPIACVSVSLRLSSPAPPAATAASQQQASRELDSEYLKHGSKRTILSTTSAAGLSLPCTLLDVAQYLSACRAGSGGEESTSSSSRFCCNSSTPASAVPGLAQRIEEHDGAFIERGEVRRQIEAAAAAASRSNDQGDHAVLLDCFFSTTTPPGIDRLALLDPPAALLLPPTQQARLDGGAAGEDEAAYNGDLGLEAVDDDNVSTTSRRQRMRDRVRRLYHGDDARRGEATGDGELAHWITPLDLSNVG